MMCRARQADAAASFLENYLNELRTGDAKVEPALRVLLALTAGECWISMQEATALDEALEYVVSELNEGDLSRSDKAQFQSDLNLLQGQGCLTMGRLPQALEKFRGALKLAEKLQSAEALATRARALWGLATVFSAQQQHAEAVRQYELALRLHLRMKLSIRELTTLVAPMYVEISYSQAKSGAAAAAIANLESVLDMYDRLDSVSLLSDRIAVLKDMANIYANENQTSKELEKLELALRVWITHNSQRYHGSITLVIKRIVRLHIARCDFKAAAKRLGTLIRLAEKENCAGFQSECIKAHTWLAWTAYFADDYEALGSSAFAVRMLLTAIHGDDLKGGSLAAELDGSLRYSLWMTCVMVPCATEEQSRMFKPDREQLAFSARALLDDKPRIVKLFGFTPRQVDHVLSRFIDAMKLGDHRPEHTDARVLTSAVRALDKFNLSRSKRSLATGGSEGKKGGKTPDEGGGPKSTASDHGAQLATKTQGAVKNQAAEEQTVGIWRIPMQVQPVCHCEDCGQRT